MHDGNDLCIPVLITLNHFDRVCLCMCCSSSPSSSSPSKCMQQLVTLDLVVYLDGIDFGNAK